MGRERACLHCGKTFRPIWNEVYCSMECFEMAGKNKKERQKPKVKGEKNIHCPICGKLFTRMTNQKYCSKECAAKAKKALQARYYREHTRIIIQAGKAGKKWTCPVCGEAFTRKGLQKYCCEACAREGERQGKKEQMGRTKICKKCGKAFPAKSTGQVYCSKECRRKATHTKTCIICGNPFQATGSNAKYCSTACKKKGTAERKEHKEGKKT